MNGGLHGGAAACELVVDGQVVDADKAAKRCQHCESQRMIAGLQMSSWKLTHSEEQHNQRAAAPEMHWEHARVK